LKAYPELGRLIIRSGRAREYRIWLLLRQIDATGRGWLYLDDVSLIVRDRLALSNDTLRRVLAAGDGTFWTIQDGRIWLAGLLKLSEIFECRPGRPFLMPNEAMGKLQTFKAFIYAGWICVQGTTKSKQGGITISRARCTDSWNVSRVTLSTWERISGISKRRNIAQLDLPLSPDLTPALDGRRFWIEGSTVCWQMPNTYASPLELAPRGMSRKARAVIDADGQRVYYSTPRDRERDERKIGRFHYQTYGFLRTIHGEGHWQASAPASLFFGIR